MKAFKTTIALFVLLFFTFNVSAQSVTLVFKGVAEPNQLVSFMITDSDADFENFNSEDIYLTEIVEADENGNFVYTTDIEDAQLDENGLITNYKLKSNIKSFDINSGLEVFDVTIPDVTELSGVLYVPVVDAFERLGISLLYNASNGTYTGEGNNGEIIITMGCDSVEIDWVDVLMPGPATSIGGVDMIPVYILSDAAKTDVFYDEANNCVRAIMPDPAVKIEEFDIAEVVSKLTGGTQVLNQYSLRSNIYSGSGADYLTISKGNYSNGYKLTLKTDYNEYGELASRIQAICGVKNFTLSQGDVGLIRFDARASRIDDESGVAAVDVLYENAGDYVKAASEQINITDQWKTYYLPVYNGFQNIGPDSRIVFDLGGVGAMTVEIKNFSFVNYGTTVDISTLRPSDLKPYKGIEDDHIWRKEAYRRIERNRKENMTVTVSDVSGNPIPGATVEVDMTENEFMFGAALCDNEVVDLDTSSLSGKTLSEFIDNDCNTGVCGLEMKMGYILDDGGVDGIKAANEFFARGKRMRGHALYWDKTGTSGLDNFENLTFDEIYRRVINHVRAAAYAYRGRLEHWDVINEPFDSAFTRINFDTTRLYSDIFKEVKKIDPDVKLYVNETGLEGRANRNDSDNIPGLLKIIRRLKREGAPVDGIGIQAHCQSYLYPQGFYHQLDECASLVDEVAVTEYDFKNINMDYADEHLRDTLLATFSHPKATAFVVWGIEDSMHWRNEAPFYNSSWEEKPALSVWRSMVNEEFATHTSLVTDSKGEAGVRAFRGDYEVKCTVDGITHTAYFRLTKDGANTVRFILEGNNLISEISNEPYVNREPLPYASVDEAEAELEQLEAPEYTGILIDANFKGCENVTMVKDGAYFSSNTAFLSGEEWATSQGSKNLLVGGDELSTILKSSGTPATVDLRRHVREAYRDDSTNVYFETMFDTMDCRESGTMDILLMVSGMSTGSRIMYSDGRYYIAFDSGKTIELSSDTGYTFRQNYKENKVICELYCGSELLETYEVSTLLEANHAEEIGYYINTDMIAESDLFKLYNARFCAYREGEIIRFTPSGLNLYEIDDTMKNFDLSTEDEWIFSGDTKAFGYATYGRYLYSQRASGTSTLKRGFAPVQTGEAIILSYDMYLNADYKWLPSASSTTVELIGEDSSDGIIVSQFGGNQYTGYSLDILNISDTPAISTAVDNGTVNKWNWRDLTVRLTVAPSGEGIFSASVEIFDADGNVIETAASSSTLTEEQVASLGSVVIRTTTSGTENQGSRLFGIRNIRLEKQGRALNTSADGKTFIADSDKLGIFYDNSYTFATHRANLIVAAYKDDSLEKVEVYPCVIDKEDGSLNFELDTTDGGADYFKVFLLKDNTLVPYKMSDKIYVSTAQ